MSVQGVNYLSDVIHTALDYCRQEFKMTAAEAVGVLHIVAGQITHDAIECSQEDDS